MMDSENDGAADPKTSPATIPVLAKTGANMSLRKENITTVQLPAELFVKNCKVTVPLGREFHVAASKIPAIDPFVEPRVKFVAPLSNVYPVATAYRLVTLIRKLGGSPL